jgi:hypothetical protein
MKSIVLKFPNSTNLLGFLVESKNTLGKSNFITSTLTGEVSDEHIVLACTKYRAYIETTIEE